MKRHLILIVDDNPINIQLLINILETGFNLVIAKNGLNALQSVKKNQPDLVLLDIKMPKMNGYEVCKQMQGDLATQNIPIIFISAMSSSNDITKGFEVGAVDYIAKPFNSAEVKARIKTHLSMSEMRKALSQNNQLLEQKVAEKTASLKNELKYREKIEQDIIHQAYYDALTDLPNRKLLQDRLEQAFIDNQQNNNFGAVIFLGLDRFKSINDSLGHTIGDTILIEAAQRIKYCLYKEDTVSRFGGDEYIVLLNNVGDIEAAANLALKKTAGIIRKKLNNVYRIDSHELYLSCSMGVILFSYKKQNRNDIIRYADTAMLYAKESGRNQVVYYNSQMHDKLEKKLLLEKDLRQAIKEQQLDIYYQPQVDSQENIVAVEALVRWQHPEHGFVNSDKFIAIAEDTGLIYDVGNFVLNKAIIDIMEINKAFNLSLNLSINISPYQFRQSEFSEIIKSAISHYQLPKNFLTLELTERCAIDDIQETIRKIKELKHLNINFSLDDFGTGYSSLSYLKQLPIDELKIDKSFVCDIAENPDDILLIQTIIKIGHQFSLSIVAEGVETNEQFAFLKKEHCDIFQGYLYSKALPIHKLKEFVAG